MSYPPGTLTLKSSKTEKPWDEKRVLQEFKLVNGETFSFNKYGFWIQIYEDKSKKKIIMSSRQTGKTTYNINQIMMLALRKPHSEIVVLVPFEKHAMTFVEILNRRIQASPKIRSLMARPDNRRMKRFKNGSQIDIAILGSSPDGVRGKTAQYLFFDEVALLPEKNVPVAMELSTTFPENAEMIFTGTPLEPENYFTQLFLEGTQNMWVVPCPYCQKNLEPIGMKNIHLDIKAVTCRDCKKPIDVTRGYWKPQNPSATYSSYHISAIMSPANRFHTPEKTGILDRLDSYSEAAFSNEVMGWPSKMGSAVFAESELQNCCKHEGKFLDGIEAAPHLQGRHLIMGIDWAFNDINNSRAISIAALFAYDNTECLECVWVRRFVGPDYHDPEIVLNEIISIASKYGVDVICTDYGVGHKENVRLRLRLMEAGVETQVVEIHYTGSSPFLKHYYKTIYHIDRTSSLSAVVVAMKLKKFSFPPYEYSQRYLKDLLNVNQKRNKSGDLTYVNPGPDDFFHCLNYALLGLKKLLQSFPPPGIFTH